MPRIPVLIVCLLAFAWPLLLPAQTATEQMRAFYEDAESFEAFFVQEVLDEEMERVQLAEGRVWLRRPDYFRWEYSAPYEQVILGDGEKLRMYDVDLAQITVRPIDEALAATPVMLLAGGVELGARFEVEDLGAIGRLQWVRVLPEVADTDFEDVRLGFGEDGLEAMELIDSFGQTTRIRFAEMRFNHAIDDERFRLEVPEGVDVVGE